MASFNVQWKSSATRELHRLDRQVIGRLVEAAGSLAEQPYPTGVRKLRGAENTYRIRIGDYRLIYVVDTGSKTVTIMHARHRGEAYR